MKIALDAMGGDNAPRINIEGAIEASKEFGSEIILVGDENVIYKYLDQYEYDKNLINIKHCTENIGMNESPAQACRQKRDASIMVAMKLVVDREAEAVISAGNSGAIMTSAMINLKRLQGVSRPAIATVVPNETGNCIMIDVGANVSCKPRHLLQFAVMGSSLAEVELKMKNPKVGLLSVGKEEGKGDETTIEAYELLKSSDLNFIGNIEGGDIFKGLADVVVCDGFVGNVVLKLSEGFAHVFTRIAKNEIKKSFIRQLSALFLRGALKDIKKKIDYAEYGGAPLVGANGVCIICHGKSNSTAIKNAIRVSGEFVKNRLNEMIVEKIGKLKVEETEAEVLATNG
ncbi:MAG: phosphate acyltransferase PlsX [bacterium]